jgi:hypothetical protein
MVHAPPEQDVVVTWAVAGQSAVVQQLVDGMHAPEQAL